MPNPTPVERIRSRRPESRDGEAVMQAREAVSRAVICFDLMRQHGAEGYWLPRIEATLRQAKAWLDAPQQVYREEFAAEVARAR